MSSLLMFSSSPVQANMYSIFSNPYWMWLFSFKVAIEVLTESVSREGCYLPSTKLKIKKRKKKLNSWISRRRGIKLYTPILFLPLFLKQACQYRVCIRDLKNSLPKLWISTLDLGLRVCFWKANRPWICRVNPSITL